MLKISTVATDLWSMVFPIFGLVGSCLRILRKPLKISAHGKFTEPSGRFGDPC